MGTGTLHSAYVGGQILRHVQGRLRTFTTSGTAVGTSFSIEPWLELVSEGLSFDGIVHDYYPDLQIEDIRACVRYAMEIVAAEEIHIAAQA